MRSALILTGAECAYLALELPVTERFEDSGGPTFRIQFIRLASAEYEATFEIVFSESELWLLDSFLLPSARIGKLPDGKPVQGFLEKVWSALLALNTPRADALLRQWECVVEETRDAEHEDHHVVTDTHAA